MDLTKKKCVPCEGGVKSMSRREAMRYLAQVRGWRSDGKKIKKQLIFRNFVQLIKFVNRLAKLAEREGHHPDFSVHYRKLDLEIWTHAISGLSENDFILAAKIDRLYSKK